jgi:glycosyltransferase involved in cell wall biosynthesis
MDSGRPRISVVIPTYQRRNGCRRAVASALEQELQPLEVLVCDDGSTDGTEDDLRAWAQEEPRLKYLRLPENQGTPAPARNLGIQSALGDWIALLDSDDRWRPEKLAAQSEHLSNGAYDVVASNATRESGGAYFDLRADKELGREEFLLHNPIITSTAVVRRSAALSAGGFPRSVAGFAIGGVEDYGLWLKLSYRGARFLVLAEELAVYDDSGAAQLSLTASRQETRVALVRWRLWLNRPFDTAVLRSAVRGTLDAGRVLRPHPPE